MNTVNKYLLKSPCLGVLAGLACASVAHAASISGTVYDEIHDQYVTGAEITIRETGQTIYAGRGGSYDIYSIDPGTYTLEARGTGLPLVTRTVTVAEGDEDQTVNFVISDQEVYELAPITVVGSLMGRAKALNIERSADNLVDVVSADAMGQFVDRNAAEALQRQPGITVIDSQGEGKYIVIRGANPDWNQVMIDGVNVATPEENGRTTALNIISTDQLESIEVTKTWTPETPAGSVGGTVNLVTRSALDRNERFASVEGAWGTYDLADEDSWRVNLVYGDVIRLGRDDRKLGVQVSFNHSVDNRGSETLRAKDWVSNTTPNLQGASPFGFSLNGLDYEDYEIKRDRIAVGGKIELQLNERNDFYLSASYNQFDDTETLQELALNASTGSSVSYRGSLYFNESIAAQLGYDLNDPEVRARLALPSNSAQKKLTYNEAEALGEIYFNPETKNYERIIAAGDTQKTFQQVNTKDRIETYQFGGEHELLTGLTLNYKLYTSEAKKEWTNNGLFLDSPELSFVIQLDPNDGYLPTMTVNNELDQLLDPETWVLNESHGRVYDYEYFSNDERNGFEFNGEYTYDLLGTKQVTSIGMAADYRDKAYNRNYQRYGDIDTEPLAQLTMSDAFFAGDATYEFLGSADRPYEFGPRFHEDNTLDFLLNTPDSVELIQTANDINYNVTDAILRNYEASEDITGAYLMQKMSTGPWSFLGGFRWEHTKNGFGNNIVKTDFDGTFIIPGYWQYLGSGQYSEWVESERSYDDILPALHIRRDLGNDWVIRAAVTKAIARPTFTDLVPFEIVDISGAMFGRSIRLPNTDLDPMRVVNYDLSVEKYLKGIGMFSVNVFYKDLDGAIYTQTRSDVAASDNEEINYYSHKYIASDIEANAATWSTSRMENTGKGELYGLEIAFDSKLRFLPWELDGIGVSANYTFVDSKVELLLEERYGEEVPLFDQADESGNLSLYYEKHGFLARLSYLWRGPYLNSVEAGETTMRNLGLAGEDTTAFDTYADSYQRLDLLLRYTFNRHFNVFIEATNLTDEPIRFYRGHYSRLASIRYTGTTWFLGAKWSL